jgi:hypothetical protein
MAKCRCGACEVCLQKELYGTSQAGCIVPFVVIVGGMLSSFGWIIWSVV